MAKRPRTKVSGPKAGASGEASAKKAKTKPPPRLNSKKAERARVRHNNVFLDAFDERWMSLLE